MIDRQAMGLLPKKPHTALRDAKGGLFYEEMHTRGGFGGPFTYFYHRYPVAAHAEVLAYGDSLTFGHFAEQQTRHARTLSRVGRAASQLAWPGATARAA